MILAGLAGGLLVAVNSIKQADKKPVQPLYLSQMCSQMDIRLDSKAVSARLQGGPLAVEYVKPTALDLPRDTVCMDEVLLRVFVEDTEIYEVRRDFSVDKAPEPLKKAGIP